jgi:uroporphyrinogen-III synthase
VLTAEQSLPAPGQGALGIELVAGDAAMAAVVAPLNDPETAHCVKAERAFSRALGGSCQVPLGGYAIIDNGQLWLRGFVATPDGRRWSAANLRGNPATTRRSVASSRSSCGRRAPPPSWKSSPTADEHDRPACRQDHRRDPAARRPRRWPRRLPPRAAHRCSFRCWKSCRSPIRRRWRPAARLPGAALAIFISPNAVDHALPAILAHGPWPAGTVPAAVGQGTVKALAACGVAGCVAPRERFDSEALLALPDLAGERVAGRRVVIFRGDGGRELLAETLRARGALVEYITCYRRAGPAGGVQLLLEGWRAGRLDALTVSSSEGLRHLLDLLDDEGRSFLARTPVFVPHARIAENARVAGLHKIILTDAADAGILAGLLAYNWPA